LSGHNGFSSTKQPQLNIPAQGRSKKLLKQLFEGFLILLYKILDT